MSDSFPDPKETLDTMLGLLGFITEIKEFRHEHGLTLQVYTGEKERLIGRNGEVLEDIQLLLNRTLQAKHKDAPKVQVDIEHWREMKDDQLAHKVRQLAEIVRKTNKESNNLYAELILRTLGRERGAMLGPLEEPGRERGDDETGLGVIRLWLTRAGIPTDRIALHDGSGLSRLNLVTPESTVLLLLSLSKTASSQPFRQSLPISGRDGTLGSRLKTLSDLVSAKTGSLTYSNSHSGYLTTAEGEQLAFSILCNDQTTRGNATHLIDQIAAILAAFPHFPDEAVHKVK